MTYADVSQIIFNNKQNIPWNDVEQYLKRYIGKALNSQSFRMRFASNTM